MVVNAPLPPVPLYYAPSSQNTATAIAARLLANAQIPSTIDSSTFSLINTLVQVVSLELAGLPSAIQLALQNTFMSTTQDMGSATKRGLERGLQPNPATFATGQVTFTGTVGTVIPSNTQIAVPGTPPIVFYTIGSATVGGGGTVTVPVLAQLAGVSGNVGAASIAILVPSNPISGISAVTNASPTSGGVDPETLAEFVQRYLTDVSQPATGDNLPTFQQWATSVAGIGGALAVRTWNGPGTVGLYLTDETGAPAAASLIASVENLIINPWRVIEPANLLTIGGFGVTTDSGQAGNQTPVIHFAYSASGVGTLTLARLDLLLTQPGIWRIRPRLKKGGTLGTGNLFRVTVNDLTTSALAPAAPSGGTAQYTFTGAQLSAAWAGDAAGTDPYGGDVFWNGTDQLSLVFTRMAADTTTDVWLDEILLQSTMPNDTPGSASLQDAADRVTVQPAGITNVVVSVHLVEVPGSNDTTVKAAVTTAVQAYLATLNFAQFNTVVFGRVGAAVLNAPGVESINWATFTVNGGQVDVTVPAGSVPVLTTPMTWT